MSNTQFKRHPHIWDNHSGVRRNPYYLNVSLADTTGSTISTVEYSREEYTVVTPRVAPCCHIVPPKAGRHPDKPKTKDAYVTNRERAQTEQPKFLPAWKFESRRKEKYNPISVSDAFDAYQQRVKTKKWAEPKIATTTHKKRVTSNETATEIVHEGPKLQKLRVTNRRNDEIKIDNCKEAEPIDDVIQKKTPGFYGTMEAEQAAEAVAVHLSYAGDNMERLRFVTEAVYPQATEHLKKIREIEDDVKDFNTQMRGHRVKVPTSAGAHTQIAHFIITDTKDL